MAKTKNQEQAVDSQGIQVGEGRERGLGHSGQQVVVEAPVREWYMAYKGLAGMENGNEGKRLDRAQQATATLLL